MKPLEKLSLKKRAKILHELFPNEISEFLDYLKIVAVETIDDKEEIARTWGNQALSAAFWNSLADMVFKRIANYEENFKYSKKLFANELFSADVDTFTIHCLLQFVKHKKHTPKFEIAIELFIKH